VHHIHVVEEAARTLHIGILRHLLHHALMLSLHHRRAFRVPFHCIFDNALPLEFFRPFGRPMDHSLRGVL